jgi:hypothetical protein
VQLLPEERRQLDLIDGTLRAETPRLAAKFDMFARLARDEGEPPAEKQFRANRAWRYKAFAHQRARRYCYAVLALLMVALVLILTLEFA